MLRLLRVAVGPLSLLLVAAGSVGATLARSDVPTSTRPAPTAPVRLVTPVLSARRLPGIVAAPAGERRLVRALGAIVGAHPESTCLVVERGGRRIYAHHPAQALVPASTLKLVVATAVLDRVGAGERLVTRAVARRPAVDGVIGGDLWVVGSGDPLLATGAYAASFSRQPQARTKLEDLAAAVARAGVRRITGSVIGDESRFDSARYVRSWKPIYVRDHETGPMSALSVNDGFVAWEPRPVPAASPARQAAAVLTELLRRRGVTVGGGPAAGTAPVGARLVAELPSLPMTAIVGEMLRESDNQTAELLVKELGRRFAGRGTTAAGIEVVIQSVRRLGLPLHGLTMADGSGLDRANAVTCDLLVGILERAGDQSVSTGLAVAGRRGTLARRFQGTVAEGRLRAKTGSINGVAGLAGYVRTRFGEELRFAFVVNGIHSVREGLGLQERLGLALAAYPDLGRSGRLGPHPVRRR